MKAKFAMGEKVRIIAGALQGQGSITEIIYPSAALQMLWGESEPHYLIKDIKSGEFISVIERHLEKV
jgi:hypothetical protein